MRKPNYKFDRAERSRGKELKKIEKLEAQAAKRDATRGQTSATDVPGAAASEHDEEHDGFERADEKEG